MSLQDEDFLTVDTLTDAQWLEIRKYAIKYHTNGYFGGDQLKCGILGFMTFLSMQDKAFAPDDAVKPQFIH